MITGPSGELAAVEWSLTYVRAAEAELELCTLMHVRGQAMGASIVLEIKMPMRAEAGSISENGGCGVAAQHLRLQR